MKVCFILNPNAGPGRRPERLVNPIHRYAETQGLEYLVCDTRYRRHGTQIAQDAVAKGFDLVVAVGGDGTVNDVASGLVHTDVEMAIVPAGSGNGLARSLNLSLRPWEALKAISHGQPKYIDVGQVGQRFFFVVAGIGFDAFVAHAYDRGRLRGTFKYFWVSFRSLARYVPEEVTVEIDGERLTHRAFVLTAANAPQFGGDAVIAPGASLSDGFLDVVLLDPMRMQEFVRYGRQISAGRIDSLPHFHTRRARHLKIERQRPGILHVDGEPLFSERVVHIGVLPGALKVRLPGDTRD